LWEATLPQIHLWPIWYIRRVLNSEAYYEETNGSNWGTVKSRIAEASLTPVEDEIRKYILREFVRNGRAPTSGEMVTGLRLPSVGMVNQTIEKLQKTDILLRRSETSGEIVDVTIVQLVGSFS